MKILEYIKIIFDFLFVGLAKYAKIEHQKMGIYAFTSMGSVFTALIFGKSIFFTISGIAAMLWAFGMLWNLYWSEGRGWAAKKTGAESTFSKIFGIVVVGLISIGILLFMYHIVSGNALENLTK